MALTESMLSAGGGRDVKGQELLWIARTSVDSETQDKAWARVENNPHSSIDAHYRVAVDWTCECFLLLL